MDRLGVVHVLTVSIRFDDELLCDTPIGYHVTDGTAYVTCLLCTGRR